jgi:Fe-S cluster biogenesis protein NfuA
MIDQYLRPLIAVDGGEIQFVRLIDKVLVIRLTGTYAGCPGKPYALSGIIEPLAKRMLGPEIRVEAES